MGLLVDGVWQDHDRDIAGAGGTFARTQSAFRNWVTPDGAPGPSGERRLCGRGAGAITSMSPSPAPGRTAP